MKDVKLAVFLIYFLMLIWVYCAVKDILSYKILLAGFFLFAFNFLMLIYIHCNLDGILTCAILFFKHIYVICRILCTDMHFYCVNRNKCHY